MNSLSVTSVLLLGFTVQLLFVAMFLHVDGSISKGAIYMLGVTSYEEARNRKNLTSSSYKSESKTNADRRDKAEVCVYFLLYNKYIR